jgi:hypothetical protein
MEMLVLESLGRRKHVVLHNTKYMKGEGDGPWCVLMFSFIFLAIFNAKM